VDFCEYLTTLPLKPSVARLAADRVGNKKKIIEGLLTQVIAVLAWFLIIDFPDKAHKKTKGFIGAKDAEFIKKRIDNDRGDAVADMLTMGKLRDHLLDWKLWSLCVLFPVSV
jgi:hypothetical protein